MLHFQRSLLMLGQQLRRLNKVLDLAPVYVYVGQFLDVTRLDSRFRAEAP